MNTPTKAGAWRDVEVQPKPVQGDTIAKARGLPRDHHDAVADRGLPETLS